MFAQMEGQENQEMSENGAPEALKCSSVCILRCAALVNARHRFFVESIILRTEMVPKWSKNGPPKLIFEGSIFAAILEAILAFQAPPQRWGSAAGDSQPGLR